MTITKMNSTWEGLPMVKKPRKRRVWESPPESRSSWKRAKRADLKPGESNRHAVKKAAKKAAKRALRKQTEA
jgi:hypothetical protein